MKKVKVNTLKICLSLSICCFIAANGISQKLPELKTQFLKAINDENPQLLKTIVVNEDKVFSEDEWPSVSMKMLKAAQIAYPKKEIVKFQIIEDAASDKSKFLVLEFDLEAIKSTEKFKEYFAEARKNGQFNNEDEYIQYSVLSIFKRIGKAYGKGLKSLKEILVGPSNKAKNQANKEANESSSGSNSGSTSGTSGDSKFNKPDINEGNGGVDNNKPHHIIAPNQIVLILQTTDKINWKIESRVIE